MRTSRILFHLVGVRLRVVFFRCAARRRNRSFLDPLHRMVLGVSFWGFGDLGVCTVFAPLSRARYSATPKPLNRSFVPCTEFEMFDNVRTMGSVGAREAIRLQRYYCRAQLCQKRLVSCVCSSHPVRLFRFVFFGSHTGRERYSRPFDAARSTSRTVSAQRCGLWMVTLALMVDGANAVRCSNAGFHSIDDDGVRPAEFTACSRLH